MRGLLTACTAVTLLAACNSVHAEDVLGVPLPPLRATGAVTYTLQESKAATDDTRTWRNTITTSVTPSTYFYAPWLATLTGTLNASLSKQSGVGSQQATNLTGNLVLGVLPRSRYPVELHYSRYSSAIPTDTETSELTGDTLRVVSRLHLPDDYSLQFDLAASQNSDDRGFEESSQEAQIVAHKQFDEHDLKLTLNHRSSDLALVGGASETGSSSGLALRHKSRMMENLTTDSTTSFRTSTFIDDLFEERSNVLQGVTTAFWRPREVQGLVVFGALRTFRQDSQVDLLETAQTRESLYQTAFANAAATYTFMPRLVGSFGLDAGYQEVEQSLGDTTAASSGLQLGGNAALNYTSVRQPVFGFDWSWTAGGTVRAQKAATMNVVSENVRTGHSVYRSLDVPLIGKMHFGAHQGVGVGHSSLGGVGISLSHNANLGRSSREGKHWDYMQFSISDSRRIGSDGSAYQLVNSQFTRGYDPDRFTSFSGSLTLQLSHQSVENGVSEGFVDTLTGELAYHRRNLFSVNGLSFSSTLSLNPPSIIRSRRYDYSGFDGGDELATGFGSQRWTNRLDFYIGKLRMSGIAILRNTPQGLGETVLFQVSRSFY